MADRTTSVPAPGLTLPPGYRRNFWCLVMDFCFFGLGLAFFGPTTVIPSFLTEVGASATVIGLLSTLQRAGWLLPQLIAARYLADKPYKKPFIVVPAAVSRSMLLLLAVLTYFAGAGRPGAVITTVMITMGIFWLCDGLASTAWFDVLSKSIPAQRRGRLTGTGQVLSGSAGFAAGFIVEWLLGDRGPIFPRNYALLFLLGFCMLAASLLALSLTKESRGVAGERVPRWSEYLPDLGRLIKRDRTFRRFLIARQLFNLSGLAAPFYMTYALENLGLPAQVAGRYTSMGVVGTVLAALLFGFLNERFGPKRTSEAGVIVTTAIPVLALAIPWVISDATWLAWAYGLVFFAVNASFSCFLPGWTAYVLEWAPEAERPAYVGLTNTINGLTALASVLGGAILQWTGGNYQLLFAITAIGTLAAFPITAALPEPRRMKQTGVLPLP